MTGRWSDPKVVLVGQVESRRVARAKETGGGVLIECPTLGAQDRRVQLVSPKFRSLIFCCREPSGDGGVEVVLHQHFSPVLEEPGLTQAHNPGARRGRGHVRR